MDSSMDSSAALRVIDVLMLERAFAGTILGSMDGVITVFGGPEPAFPHII